MVFHSTVNYDESFAKKPGSKSHINLITEFEELKVSWTIACTYYKDYCRWTKIKLQTFNRTIHGNFVIQPEVIELPEVGNFDLKLSSKFEQNLLMVECFENSYVKITIFIYCRGADETVPQSVADDYDKFCGKQELSDITFFVENEKIPAHKQILSARSEVFSKIFCSEVENKKSVSVVIPNIEPKIFKLFLRFIYGGKVVTKDTKDLVKLVVAGAKYSENSLIKICEESLYSKLTVDNVVGILMTADIVKVETLKKKCMDFVVDHKDEVISTEGYKYLIKSGRSDLLSEVLRRIGNILLINLD